MSPDRDPALLADMLRHARLARDFCQGVSLEEFLADVKLQMAVAHVMQIVGEAAGKVSRPYRDAHPDVPWTRIIAFRHRAVHEYPRIEMPIVHRIATEHIHQTIAALERLIDPNDVAP
jgi:uncharacterized protein with HEPN domain